MHPIPHPDEVCVCVHQTWYRPRPWCIDKLLKWVPVHSRVHLMVWTNGCYPSLSVQNYAQPTGHAHILDVGSVWVFLLASSLCQSRPTPAGRHSWCEEGDLPPLPAISPRFQYVRHENELRPLRARDREATETLAIVKRRIVSRSYIASKIALTRNGIEFELLFSGDQSVRIPDWVNNSKLCSG